MTFPQKDPSALLSQDDREAALQRLQEAYAEERISHEEMEQRLDQVLTAKTHGEVASALAALPEENSAPTATIAAAGGRIQRRGAWRVPRSLKVGSAYGRVHLDLSRAIIEHPAVDIELQLGTGGAKITVPRDATVDIEDLNTGWKDLRYKAPRSPHPGGPKIRIFGTMGFGRLKIRHARR
ncbi:DUF1707 and DUF2154 domain-containing protein [Streptomyces albofaciens JCM 4342]|uniref:DUF1707 SHOCT-like domain-containing protein n=1 Tax=Streptomyces albofaciens TaxID=66866 RepID=UPI000B2E03DE|nr:DUF1707 domain-containing protein [Streptomyces albofaciens]KAA6223984.1 DUF1707 and DUF2154 domain-containing protein [Streptomyces albofaciens JCM 4342]